MDIVITDSNTSVSDGVCVQDPLLKQLEDVVFNGDSTLQSLDSDGRRSNTQSSEDIKKTGASSLNQHCPREKLLSSANVTNYLFQVTRQYINCNCLFFNIATVYGFQEIVTPKLHTSPARKRNKAENDGDINGVMGTLAALTSTLTQKIVTREAQKLAVVPCKSPVVEDWEEYCLNFAKRVTAIQNEMARELIRNEMEKAYFEHKYRQSHSRDFNHE